MTRELQLGVVAILGAGGALGAAISSRLAAEPDTEIVLSDVSEASLQADASTDASSVTASSATASRPCSPT